MTAGLAIFSSDLILQGSIFQTVDAALEEKTNTILDTTVKENDL